MYVYLLHVQEKVMFNFHVGWTKKSTFQNRTSQTYFSIWWIISRLENINQIWSFPQVGVKHDKYLEPPPTT